MIIGGASAVLEWYLPRRRRALERVARRASAVQEATLLALVRRARDTEFGLAYDFDGVRSVADYPRRVPVADYLAFRPWWSRGLGGERNLTWPGRPPYWVKTSGTTAGDKVLPVTPQAITSHRKGGWGAMLMAVERAGAATLLGGSLLFPAGSSAFAPIGQGGRVGDLSGLMVRRLPPIIRSRYSPGRSISAIGDWENAHRGGGDPGGRAGRAAPVRDALVGAHPLRSDRSGSRVDPFSEEPRGGHDWLVEFAEPPRCSLDLFTRVLDETLMRLNTDYRTKRAAGVGMVEPRLVELPAGTFYRWMRGQGKLGDQHKVPRVTNDRAMADRLLATAAAPSAAPDALRDFAAL